jgi:hypothetical protein
MAYTEPLHPELQAIWDDVKGTMQAAADKAGEAYQAYEQWGQQNREKVPGLGAMTEALGQVAETPGMDYMFPAVGYTSASAMRDMAHGILNKTRVRLNPEETAGLKKMAENVTESFTPSSIERIKGPNPDPLNQPGWGYASPAETSGIFRGDQFFPTSIRHTNPEILFNPRELLDALQTSYGTKMPKKGMFNKMIQSEAGMELPMVEHRFGKAHETGHGIGAKIAENPEDWRSIFGWNKDFDIYDPFSFNTRTDPMRLNQGLTEDMNSILAQAQNRGISLPWYIDQHRPAYWKLGSVDPTRSPQLDELIADYYGLSHLGLDPQTLFKNTIVNREPLLPHLNLQKLKELAGK